MFNLSKNDIKVIGVSFAISIIYLIPMFMANGYTNDDYMRSFSGVSGWEENGRPLSSIMMSILGLMSGGVFFGKNALIDVFPFNLILSALIFTIAGLSICRSIGIKNITLQVLVSISFMLNPFFLGNIAFRFDTLTMAASSVFAVFATTFAYNKGWKYFLLSVIMVFAMLCTYQASMNLMVALAVFIFCAKTINDNTNQILSLVKCGLSLIFSYAIYSMTVPNIFTFNRYTIESSEMLKPKQILSGGILNNISLFYEGISGALSGAIGYILISLVIIIQVILLCKLKHIKLENHLTQLTSKIIIALMPVILMALLPGALLLLKNPKFTSRVILAYPVVVIACIYTLSLIKNSKASYFSAILLVCSFPICATTGNALKLQSDYDNFIAQRIVGKLYDLGYNDSSSLLFWGKRIYQPDVERMVSNMPIIKDVIYPAMANHNWKYYLLGHYGLVKQSPPVSELSEFKKNHPASKPRFKDKLFSIYVEGNTYAVIFN